MMIGKGLNKNLLVKYSWIIQHNKVNRRIHIFNYVDKPDFSMIELITYEKNENKLQTKFLIG